MGFCHEVLRLEFAARISLDHPRCEMAWYWTWKSAVTPSQRWRSDFSKLLRSPRRTIIDFGWKKMETCTLFANDQSISWPDIFDECAKNVIDSDKMLRTLRSRWHLRLRKPAPNFQTNLSHLLHICYIGFFHSLVYELIQSEIVYSQWTRRATSFVR